MASKSPAAAPDADEALKLAWDVLGRPDGYEAPSEQEMRDLTDARNRGRGQKAQRKRLKRNRQLLERERAAEQGLDPPSTSGPALPHYLLDRDKRVVSSDFPPYLFVQESQLSGSDDSSSGEDDAPARKLERRADRWSANAAAQEACIVCRPATV